MLKTAVPFILNMEPNYSADIDENLTQTASFPWSKEIILELGSCFELKRFILKTSYLNGSNFFLSFII